MHQLWTSWAPAVDGPPEFLRALRVQMDTVEQTVFFLQALWLGAAAGITGLITGTGSL